MKRKAFIFSACLVFLLVLISSIVVYTRTMSSLLSHSRELNSELIKKLNNYNGAANRLENMHKALLVSYNITSYEARYYSFIFDDFSQKYGIPWEVYPALVRIESNFNPGVMSRERAKGLTQVLESTGKSQAEKLNIPYNDGTLWNSILNMVIGFDYFSEGYAEKIKDIPQDSALKHAMRRYCGGPGYARVNDSARIYVKEYRSTLWDEYLRVSYIYKGVMYDQLIVDRNNYQQKKSVNKNLTIKGLTLLSRCLDRL